jgi:hypothetical protein
MNQLHVILLYDKIVLTVSLCHGHDCWISGISLCHWMESAQPVDQMNQRQQQIEHFHRLMFILCVRAAAAWLVASKLTHEPFQNVCVTAWLFPFYSYIVLALAGTWHCFILSLSFSNLFVYCLFYCRECASASSTCAFNRILASTEASASTPTRARSASAEILTTTDLFVRKVSAAQLFIHLSIPKWIMLMPWTCKWLSDLGLSIRWLMCDDIND